MGRLYIYLHVYDKNQPVTYRQIYQTRPMEHLGSQAKPTHLPHDCIMGEGHTQGISITCSLNKYATNLIHVFESDVHTQLKELN